nr:MAG TPA: hypothetical protein [Caudoviricetes sp.]
MPIRLIVYPTINNFVVIHLVCFTFAPYISNRYLKGWLVRVGLLFYI